MFTPSLYLCVDCGGTKTSAVVCNDAPEIVGRALGGPSNFSYLGLQAFVAVLKSTVEKALSHVTDSSNSVDLSVASRFASVWIGISGVDSPSDIRTLTTALSQLFSIPPGNRLQITNDAHLLASPLRMHKELESAVAVIAGTGSVVISFSKQGETEGNGSITLKEMARAGGWGWILGDAGSGFEVGREAVREILFRADRSSVNGSVQGYEGIANMDKKTLEFRILSHFGITNASEIFALIYAPDPSPNVQQESPSTTTNTNENNPTPPISEGIFSVPREHRLSKLSPLVFQSAFEDGDELALMVLRRCAESLASQISMLLATPTDFVGAKPNAVEATKSILCLGGSLVGVAAYRDLILDELKAKGHVFAAVEFVGGGDVAAIGAMGLAMSANSGGS